VSDPAEEIPAPQADSASSQNTATEIFEVLPDPHADALRHFDDVDKGLLERDFDKEEEHLLILLNTVARALGTRRLPFDSFEQMADDAQLAASQVTRVKSRLARWTMEKDKESGQKVRVAGKNALVIVAKQDGEGDGFWAEIVDPLQWNVGYRRNAATIREAYKRIRERVRCSQLIMFGTLGVTLPPASHLIKNQVAHASVPPAPDATCQKINSQQALLLTGGDLGQADLIKNQVEPLSKREREKKSICGQGGEKNQATLPPELAEAAAGLKLKEELLNEVRLEPQTYIDIWIERWRLNQPWIRACLDYLANERKKKPVLKVGGCMNRHWRYLESMSGAMPAATQRPAQSRSAATQQSKAEIRARRLAAQKQLEAAQNFCPDAPDPGGLEALKKMLRGVQP
jgi:hypothetical protein